MTSPTCSPRATVDAYIEGTRNRDIALLKQLFHDDAVMTGWFDGSLGVGGPGPFYQELEQNEVGQNYTGTVVSVVQTDRIATAQVDETNLLGVSFSNHFHLIQIDDGNWRIISKRFRQY